jgi:hypothetical protein
MYSDLQSVCVCFCSSMLAILEWCQRSRAVLSEQGSCSVFLFSCAPSISRHCTNGMCHISYSWAPCWNVTRKGTSRSQIPLECFVSKWNFMYPPQRKCTSYHKPRAVAQWQYRKSCTWVHGARFCLMIGGGGGAYSTNLAYEIRAYCSEWLQTQTWLPYFH